MWIRRTLPPTAAPLSFRDIIGGLQGWFGEERAVDRLRQELADYFGVPDCWLISSGKAALTLILKAMHSLSPQKSTVLIPAYTCYSVASSVVKAGLSVNLGDIDPQTLDFDYSRLESQVSDQTLCLVVNHLLGRTADVDRCLQLASSRGIWVVEDAAQAMGTFSRGKPAGTRADAGFFSLGRGKVICAVEGGVILTRNPDLAAAVQREYQNLPVCGFREKAILLAKAIALTCFLRPSLYWLPDHLPFLKLGQTEFSTRFALHRMSGFQCGLMRGWKQKIARLNQSRLERTQCYRRLLAGAGLSPSQTGQDHDGEAVPLLRFPLILENTKQRDQLYRKARHLGLGISRMYPDSIDSIDQLKGQVSRGNYPAASRLARTLLTLPTHPLISLADQRRIARLITLFREIITKE